MKKSSLSLEQQLAETEKLSTELQKKSAALRNKIEAKNNANKPKSIMERVKTMKDVLKIAKPTEEELVVLNYSGKSKRLLFSKYMMILGLIVEVLNEGHEFKMDGSEYRYYPYFMVSSGFVFYSTSYDVTNAGTPSASRLCFKTRELAECAGEIFFKEYKNAITM